ncbi:MAG: exodeoxyribonuclease VII small subunit [Desulfobacula sp.]|nr:exodeoxyribonuclease VII small subunit [Desulfobacula sp.]
MGKKTFETSLKELEEIVKQMESNDLDLEDAVKKYEKGIKESKYCLNILDKTEKKISLLSVDNSGNLQEKPFK